jgi:hypothetical protein
MLSSPKSSQLLTRSRGGNILAIRRRPQAEPRWGYRMVAGELRQDGLEGEPQVRASALEAGRIARSHQSTQARRQPTQSHASQSRLELRLHFRPDQRRASFEVVAVA